MVFAAGSIVGPILGGFLDDQIGFEATADLIAAVAFGFCILYGFIVFCNCNCGGTKKVIDTMKRE